MPKDDQFAQYHLLGTSHQPPPPPPPPPSLRAHPKAPYLRLVVSQESPAFLNFGTGDLLQSMFEAVKGWRAAANPDDRTA